MREYICTRSTWCWPLKLFLSLIDVACVNAFVLWMLKHPNWEQKKNNRRHLYLLSLGEEMVTPYIRGRADSGNVDRHTDSNGRHLQTNNFNSASTTDVKKNGGRRHGTCCSVQQLRTEKQTGNVAIAENGCARTTLSRQFK